MVRQQSEISWFSNQEKKKNWILQKMEWKIAIYRKWRFLGNLTKYRNLQIINCDIGRDVINSPPARKEYRNLQIYLEKSQLSQLSQKSQISQFMLSRKCVWIFAPKIRIFAKNQIVDDMIVQKQKWKFLWLWKNNFVLIFWIFAPKCGLYCV